MSREQSRCEARRQQDQMQCARCGLAWDVDDNDPPRCPADTPPAPAEIIEQIKFDLSR